MTDLGVRVLIIVIVATGLAGLFGWVAGTFMQVEGPEFYIVHAVLIVVYFLLLVGLWNLLKRITTQADTSKDVSQEH